MAKFYYNGVLLHEIPADVLAEYPYALIFNASMGETSLYGLMCSKTTWYYDNYNNDNSLDGTKPGGYCSFVLTDTGWIQDMEPSAGVPTLTLGQQTNGATLELLWSNFDIYNFTGGGIYFYATEPTTCGGTQYSIYESTLTDMADALREKTGKTDPIKVTDMASEIRGIQAGAGGVETVNQSVKASLAASVDDQYAANAQVSECELYASFYAEIVNQLYTYNCAEVSSGTSLETSVDCTVGDLVIASIITRDTLTLSDGWTLISTSNVNSTDTTNGQRLSFAYKYATNTTESITVTQASSQRLYITMVALQGATGFVDNGYSYVDSGVSSITVTKPSGLVLFGCSAPLWDTTSPYPLWVTSNDSVIIQLGTSTQSRLGVILDETGDTEVTITSGASGTTLIVGSLTIEGLDSVQERIPL